MTDQQMKFAEGFAMPTYEQWVAEVEKALKGAPFDKRMYTKTYEGVTLRPIYTRQDWPSAGDPSGFPALCRSPAADAPPATGSTTGMCRQSYAYPDPFAVQRHHPQRPEPRRHVDRDRLRCRGTGRARSRCTRSRRRSPATTA